MPDLLASPLFGVGVTLVAFALAQKIYLRSGSVLVITSYSIHYTKLYDSTPIVHTAGRS